MSKSIQHNTPSTAQRGFTLIELMVTLAVLAIVVTLAVPSFSSFMANQRVKTAAQDLFMAMMYARSEAIKRNGNVYIKSNSGDWHNGWAVMIVDQTYASCSDGNADDANCIKVYAAKSGVTVTDSADSFNYNRSGRSSANVTLNVCDSDNKATTIRRTIEIDPSGRPNIKQDGYCNS